MCSGWLRQFGVHHTDNYIQKIWLGVYICVYVCVFVCVHAHACGAGGPWLLDIQLSYMINFQH